MIYIDSDNAMGSWTGDVDDGFAIAALLCSGMRVAAIGAVDGNTSRGQAEFNNRKIGEILHYAGPYLSGSPLPDELISPAVRFLLDCKHGLRVAALGPLTNLASALRSDPSISKKLSEVVVVGTTRTSRGRWPPYWPHEFNLTHDRVATETVFQSDVPLTIIPLDVAGTMRVKKGEIPSIVSPLGQFLRTHSRRWFWRTLLFKARGSIALFDFVAAMYLIDDSLFDLSMETVKLHSNGWVEYGAGSRKVLVIKGFSPEEIWGAFRALVRKHAE